VDIPLPEADKAAWRTWARRKRADLDFATLSGPVVEELLDWPVLAASRRVLLFFPLGNEIDLRALLDAGLNCSFTATRTPDHGGLLTVHELGGPLEVHRIGFLQPHVTAPEVDPADLDLLLLPGLAFDLWGTRLGRGGGYFDRFLMRVPATAALVGVTPAGLVVDRLPSEPHDVAVRYLATEEGVIDAAS